MTEKPILFNSEMVRALLSDKKTQTRRPVSPCKYPDGCEPCHYSKTGWAWTDPEGGCTCKPVACPFGVPGDVLYVREATRLDYWDLGDTDRAARYVADGEWVWDLSKPCRWFGKNTYKPPMHMPRGWSRIKLEVLRVWVERVTSISQEDARAEGVEPGCLTCGENCHKWGGCGCCNPSYRDSFAWLWRSICTGEHSWESNCWVWCCEFKRLEES